MARAKTLQTILAVGLIAAIAAPANAQTMIPGGSEAPATYAPAPVPQPAPSNYVSVPSPHPQAQKQMHYLPANPYDQQAQRMQPDQAQLQPQDPAQTAQQAYSGEPALPVPETAPVPSDGVMRAVQQGNVRYITGGIGDEERDALAAVKGEYNLHVTSTNKDGEFNGDTKITIVGKGGEKLVNVDAGPLFYAQLPAGTYTVQAVNGGVEKQQKVTIGGNKDARVYFRW